MRPFHLSAPGVSAWVDLDHIQVITDIEFNEHDVEPHHRKFVTELMPPAGFYIQYAFRDMRVLYGTPLRATIDDIDAFCDMHQRLITAWSTI